MDGKNPLMTFEEYREQELRWYWYSLPEGSSEAEREAGHLQEPCRDGWVGLVRLR